MRWVSGKKGSVRKDGGNERGLLLFLLTSHKRRVIVCRVTRVQSVSIKVTPSCSLPLELFLKSIDLLTLSHLSDFHNYSAHSN